VPLTLEPNNINLASDHLVFKKLRSSLSACFSACVRLNVFLSLIFHICNFPYFSLILRKITSPRFVFISTVPLEACGEISLKQMDAFMLVPGIMASLE